MGGSAWQYYVPFEGDVQEALGRLREEVFRSGAFYAAPGARRPANVDDLLELSGESGTHSILDVVGVAPRPAPGYVAPLSASETVQTFGTERPSRHDIGRAGAAIDAIRLGRGRWTGSYVVVYQDDAPRELFFFGYSGD